MMLNIKNIKFNTLLANLNVELIKLKYVVPRKKFKSHLVFVQVFVT